MRIVTIPIRTKFSINKCNNLSLVKDFYSAYFWIKYVNQIDCLFVCLKDTFNTLIDDNKCFKLSINYRLSLEKDSIDNPELFDQICSCNSIRFILDDLCVYKNYELSKLNYLSQVSFTQ